VDIKPTTFSYSLTIREGHLDTFGHVNNATYLALFEEARWQMVTDRGYGLEKVRQTQQGPIILEVQVQFRRELTLRTEVNITSRTTKYAGKIGQVYQEIANQLDPTLVYATATFTIGFFDLSRRKLIPPSPEWLRAIGASP
jgi:acyl-CoA thioester hydrolase